MVGNMLSGEPNMQEVRDKENFRFVIAFGFGFITLMFLAFICGFYFAKYILLWSDTNSFILSIVTGTGTIVIETLLFILKMERMEKIERDEEKRLKKSS